VQTEIRELEEKGRSMTRQKDDMHNGSMAQISVTSVSEGKEKRSKGGEEERGVQRQLYTKERGDNFDILTTHVQVTRHVMPKACTKCPR
jgi:hypothetical protein